MAHGCSHSRVYGFGQSAPVTLLTPGLDILIQPWSITPLSYQVRRSLHSALVLKMSAVLSCQGHAYGAKTGGRHSKQGLHAGWQEDGQRSRRGGQPLTFGLPLTVYRSSGTSGTREGRFREGLFPAWGSTGVLVLPVKGVGISVRTA